MNTALYGEFRRYLISNIAPDAATCRPWQFACVPTCRGGNSIATRTLGSTSRSHFHYSIRNAASDSSVLKWVEFIFLSSSRRKCNISHSCNPISEQHRKVSWDEVDAYFKQYGHGRESLPCSTSISMGDGNSGTQSLCSEEQSQKGPPFPLIETQLSLTNYYIIVALPVTLPNTSCLRLWANPCEVDQ